MSSKLIGLNTLVLNSNYLPINLIPMETIPVEDAITRVFNGTCHVVSNHKRKILTPNRNDLYWPSVIARNDSKMVKPRVKMTDENLYYRDHGLCQYCHKEISFKETTFDHVYPKSKGGQLTWTNLVCACESCNSRKDDHLPVGEWKPKRLPFKPTYHQLLDSRKKFPLLIDDEEWMNYIPQWEAEVRIRKEAQYA